MSDYVKQAIDVAQARASPLYATSADEVFIKTEIFEKWAAEVAADDWVGEGLAAVVKDMVIEADSCGSGAADGTITWAEVTCFIRSIDSYASFLQRVFDGVS